MQKIITDTIDRQIKIDFPPKHIISLVPSITELLFDLGLEKNIAGITKFCIHPRNKTKTIPKVGGTKDFDKGKIIELQPDLVIANKEENPKAETMSLASLFPVFVTNVTDYRSALTMIAQIGEITDTRDKAKQIVSEIENSFQKLPKKKNRKKAIYLIWRKPYMTVGKNTFISAMMEKAGFENVFAGKKDNYPVITSEEIKDSGAEIILLSSEPYRFGKKHFEEFQAILPRAEIRLVDGEMFTWYGSRMRLSADYFKKEF